MKDAYDSCYNRKEEEELLLFSCEITERSATKTGQVASIFSLNSFISVNPGGRQWHREGSKYTFFLEIVRSFETLAMNE